MCVVCLILRVSARLYFVACTVIICCLRRSSDQNYSIDLGLFDVCTITHLHLNGKKLLEVIICIFFFF